MKENFSNSVLEKTTESLLAFTSGKNTKQFMRIPHGNFKTALARSPLSTNALQDTAP